MNYAYDEIKEKIIDNCVIHQVKNFSINKNDIDTFYFIGEKLFNYKITSEKALEKLASRITADLEICVPKEVLSDSLNFYSLVKKGMIKNYKIKWEEYEILIKLNDISKINEIINERYFLYE